MRDTQEKRACVMWFSKGNLIWRTSLIKGGQGLHEMKKPKKRWEGKTGLVAAASHYQEGSKMRNGGFSQKSSQ